MTVEGWIPGRLVWEGGEPRVRWLLLGSERLVDPFFEQTIQRTMRHPFHLLFRQECSLDEMVEMLEAARTVPLRGIIFHMSRCGSTLVSQMLASSPRNLVVSEAAPLDALLRAPQRLPQLSRDRMLRWLRGMVAALGQPRAGAESRLFLKMDAWQVHHAALLREAFPDVPFVFIYRDPLEVMQSHAAMPAPWIVPGSVLSAGPIFGIRPDVEGQRYRADLLLHICKRGLQSAQADGTLLIPYGELPGAMYGRIFRLFGLELAEVPSMMDQSLRDAKSPARAFQADGAIKQASADPALRMVVEEVLAPVYRELEACREGASEVPGTIA